MTTKMLQNWLLKLRRLDAFRLVRDGRSVILNLHTEWGEEMRTLCS